MQILFDRSDGIINSDDANSDFSGDNNDDFSDIESICGCNQNCDCEEICICENEFIIKECVDSCKKYYGTKKKFSILTTDTNILSYLHAWTVRSLAQKFYTYTDPLRNKIFAIEHIISDNVKHYIFVLSYTKFISFRYTKPCTARPRFINLLENSLQKNNIDEIRNKVFIYINSVTGESPR